jgi:ribosome-associated translation inhibitor RaiA/cold shock CspA family protein
VPGQEASMQVPLEIAFHNLEKIDWAEEEIRDHVARLEEIHDRIISCRVRVDKRATNANDTIPPVVRIEITVPGNKDIVVAHEPDHLQRKFQRPDLHNAINEAFRIAERRLSEYKEQLKDYVKGGQHAAGKEIRGQVAEMRPAEDFGFLMTPEGGLLYFHRNSVVSGDFATLNRGDEVTYVEDMGDTGPVATRVRVKARTASASAESSQT